MAYVNGCCFGIGGQSSDRSKTKTTKELQCNGGHLKSNELFRDVLLNHLCPVLHTADSQLWMLISGSLCMCYPFLLFCRRGFENKRANCTWKGEEEPTYIVLYLINPTQARKLISSLIEKPLYATRRLTKWCSLVHLKALWYIWNSNSKSFPEIPDILPLMYQSPFIDKDIFYWSASSWLKDKRVTQSRLVNCLMVCSSN